MHINHNEDTGVCVTVDASGHALWTVTARFNNKGNLCCPMKSHRESIAHEIQPKRFHSAHLLYMQTRVHFSQRVNMVRCSLTPHSIDILTQLAIVYLRPNHQPDCPLATQPAWLNLLLSQPADASSDS